MFRCGLQDSTHAFWIDVDLQLAMLNFYTGDGRNQNRAHFLWLQVWPLYDKFSGIGKQGCLFGEVIRDLATQVGTNERYVAWVLRFKHLAPDMIEAILDGRQPIKWTTDTFIKARKFPYVWDVQRRQFGFTLRR